jgi:hypothetical protein
MTGPFDTSDNNRTPMAPKSRQVVVPLARASRPARASSGALNRVDTRSEIAGLANEARDAGGWLARLRLTRQANVERIGVVNEAVASYFAKKREEIELALNLDSDNNRKRLLAASMEETNVIEREVTRLIRECQRELQLEAMDDEKVAGEEEIRRIEELDRLLAENRITPRRHAQAVANVEAAIDERIERGQHIVRRLFDNLEHRLSATLKDFEPPPRL